MTSPAVGGAGESTCVSGVGAPFEPSIRPPVDSTPTAANEDEWGGVTHRPVVATAGALATAPSAGVAIGGTNPVCAYVERVRTMLDDATRPAPRIGLDELLALTAEAARRWGDLCAGLGEARARAFVERLTREVGALRDCCAADPLAALALDTLGIILAHSPDAPGGFTVQPVATASDGRPAYLARAAALEGYLRLAAEGARARGLPCDAWTVPVVSGSIPKDGDADGTSLSIQDVAGRLDALIGAVGAGSRAVYVYSEAEARTLVDAAAREGRPVIITGHSMGGVNAINLANDYANVALIVPIDPHHVAESAILFGLIKPPRTVRDGVEVLSFYQRATPLQGNRNIRRSATGGTPVHNTEVTGTTEGGAGVGHMTIVDILYERGVLQMALTRAMFRNRAADRPAEGG